MGADPSALGYWSWSRKGESDAADQMFLCFPTQAYSSSITKLVF